MRLPLIGLSGEITCFPGSRIVLRGDGRSEAHLRLDPSDPAAIALSDDPSYEIDLLEESGDGLKVAPVAIMRDAILRAADYERAYRGPAGSDPGEDRRYRTAIFQDTLFDFKTRAPAEHIIHEQTDSLAELEFVTSAISQAATRPLTDIPPVAIPRIDYTRDQSYWDVLAPYFAPWEPIDLTDPTSHQIRLFQTVHFSGSSLPHAGALSTADYNAFPPSIDAREVVNQVRVIWLDFSGEDGPPPVVLPRPREEEVIGNADGSKTVVWRESVDLADDPDDPTKITREDVATGEGQSRIVDGREQSETRTLYEYEADYTRLVTKTTTVKMRVNLPGAEDQYLTVKTETETLTYKKDTKVPGRRLLARTEVVTSGLYVYTYVDTGDPVADEAAALLTATPVDTATWNGTIDTSPTSSQHWATGQLSTVVETRRRTNGGRIVSIAGTESDDLRRITKRTWRRTELGDTAVDAGGRARYEYIPETPSGLTLYRKAYQLDATKIGRGYGEQIAAALIARSAKPIRTIRLRVMRPSYANYRFGVVVSLDATAPYGMEGPYVITQVEFVATRADANRHGLEQYLTLTRLW